MDLLYYGVNIYRCEDKEQPHLGTKVTSSTPGDDPNSRVTPGSISEGAAPPQVTAASLECFCGLGGAVFRPQGATVQTLTGRPTSQHVHRTPV